MNRKYDILFIAVLLLLTGGCLQSCQQDDFGEPIPDPETLLAQGRYLTARNAEAAAAADDSYPKPFEVNTPYRLLAFTKLYDATQPGDATPAAHPRFNKVAWEGATGGLHFINIDQQPDKWFGFAAIGEETPGSDGLVSLDFYGFTYGKPLANQPQANRPPIDYIELDAPKGETTPEAGSLASLKRWESVSADLMTLNDLLRGELLNQNIHTAGKDAAVAMQSVLPFTHCFSKLHFRVVQQKEDEPDENNNPVPCFPNVQIEKLEVTNTYGEGAVYLQNGQVELAGDPIRRPLRFADDYKGAVPLKIVDMGEMIVFPSAGEDLKNEDKADGYSVGLAITVKSTNRKDIEQFLANTDSPVESLEEVTEAGTTYYRGIIVKESIIDNYTNKTLHFKRNTEYWLVLSFQKNAVRIITVIPQVEEWLPGEGTEENPWQEQALGQPQMFDNIVWSDRNLGADHYDPISDNGKNFEKTIGYFYQSGRNIPYYPFDSRKYYNEETKTFTSHPLPEDKNQSVLADVDIYYWTRHRFYPIVDTAILTMYHQMSGWGKQESNWGSDRTWMIEYKNTPQMSIPEKAPKDEDGNAYSFFDFMRSKNSGDSGLSNNYDEKTEKTSNYDMEWEDGAQNQPVAGAWIIPTSSQFMTIFPSTPHAGNITFRAGGNNNQPMNWGHPDGNEMNTSEMTLRVTVPYYYDGMSEPTGRSAAYRKAWKTLNDNNDTGTTKINAYRNGGPDTNIGAEPDGDPEDGYASVYVISRNKDSKGGLPEELQNDNRFCIKSWGTIYAIKRVYTPQAYRLRIRVRCAGVYGTKKNPGLYVEICRYRCSADKTLTEENYMTDEFDWDHPAATIYFPICGLGDWTGNYINFGTECQYATSDPIEGSMTTALQIKITGDNDYNTYMAIIRKASVNRDFGKQIRPVGGGYN